MKQELERIYRALASGELSQQDAMLRIATLRRKGGEALATLLASPQWEAVVAPDGVGEDACERLVLLRGFGPKDAEALSSRLAPATCRVLEGEGYEALALGVFEALRGLMRARPQSPARLQLVATGDEAEWLIGLAGMFETARLENPAVAAQLVLVSAGVDGAALARGLRAEWGGSSDVAVRLDGSGRQARRWRVIDEAPTAPDALRQGGVYLIAGGLGGLGRLFAREMLSRGADVAVVLAGRSEPEQALLAELQALGRVEYARADISNPAETDALVADILARHGRLDGVIHSSGLLRDEFILKKTADSFRAVLAPKVAGCRNLDRATRALPLDFFVLFSSIASWAGNLGQADYAAANGFLEQFAVYRNRLAAVGERSGRTAAIAWPHWLDGGMHVDAADMDALRRRTGMGSLSAEAGIQAWRRCLSQPQGALMAMHGDPAAMRKALEPRGHAAQPMAKTLAATAEPADLAARTRDFLRRVFAGALKLPPERIEGRAALEKYGIDSILAMNVTGELEKTFGTLAKTLFFEYRTLDELADYFLQAQKPALLALFAPEAQAPEASAPITPAAAPAIARRGRPQRSAAPSMPASSVNEPIAIVGLSGRYPEAWDLAAYWRNLSEGRDCIVEVPASRWDWREHYSEDRGEAGRHYSKWGGFIEGVDAFDPRFFNISPKEAAGMDPQERLFLQHAWQAIEDAGLNRAALQAATANGRAGQVGVYAGVMYGEYNLSGSLASIANRTSYFLDLHGPSLTLDTMCSSSLTAIHLACQDLRQGRTALALAGGVNVTVHPNKYLMLSAGQFISGDGHCQSFGEGGDGYIPGEGVGVAVLKRLSDAERDGNHIYGLIRGSALNHGGKTNGYTVPSPQAQAEVIRMALTEAGVAARDVGYIEAHGTGTKLGDPIEIAALTRAFYEGEAPDDRQAGFCRIGSAKSNIGHCESAAGIAGVTKVLLQMKHGAIAPSLHSSRLNPHIDFASTPFVVNQTLSPWARPARDGRELPRVAGVSSFGAGGSNAHLIIEEYHPARGPQTAAESVFIAPLSARTPEHLRQRALDLLERLRAGGIDIRDLARTLQSGREPMIERAAFVAASSKELQAQLEVFIRDGRATFRGSVKSRDMLTLDEADAQSRAEAEHAIAAADLSKLAKLWAQGLDWGWERLRADGAGLVSLPGYPFARERYWQAPAAIQPARSVLHPLAHANVSSLAEQAYETRLSGDETFLETVGGFTRLPALLMLEMARFALDAASESRGGWALSDIRWGEPARAGREHALRAALLARDDEHVDVEIHTGEAVHCQLHAERVDEPLAERHDLSRLRAGMRAAASGLWSAEGRRLAALQSGDEGGEWTLSPRGLRMAASLLDEMAGLRAEPLSLAELRLSGEPGEAAWLYLRQAEADVFDIDFCDAGGQVLARLAGLRRRAAAPELATQAEAPRADEPPRPPAPMVSALPASRGKPVLVALSEAAETVAAPLAAKARLSLPDVSAAGAAGESDRLRDLGDGIFHLDVPGGDLAAGLASLLRELEQAGRMSSLKALLLAGGDESWRGGRETCDAAIASGLPQAVARFPFPLIASPAAGAVGAGWLLSLLCDFMVLAEDAEYGYADPAADLFPSGVEDRLLRARLGEALAEATLYRRPLASGAQLARMGLACPVAARGEAAERALALARDLADKPAEALRLLKAHLGRKVAALAAELAPAGLPEAAASPAEDESLRQGALLVASAASDQKWRPAAMAAELRAAYARADMLPACRSIVLSGLPAGLSGDAGQWPAAEAEVLRDALRASPLPLIVACDGDATGLAWWLCLWCDAAVFVDEGRYGFAGLASAPALEDEAARLAALRLGGKAARELSLDADSRSGLSLGQLCGAAEIADAAGALPRALALASQWRGWPRGLARDWKARRNAELSALPPVEPAGAAPAQAESFDLDFGPVSLEIRPDGVALVAMCEREAKNMFTPALVDGLKRAFAHAAAAPACRAVVLTGHDGYFATGGTRETLQAIQKGQAQFTDEMAFQLALACPLPVLSAMQGHAIGGGWAFGMFADLAWAAEEARYFNPYMSYGFTPGAGSTLIFPERLGLDLARETLLTAREQSGADLASRGMPALPRRALLDAALERAARIASQPRERLVRLKRLLAQPLLAGRDEAYRLEVAMHEATFVRNDDTLRRIESRFAGEPPQEVRVAGSPTVGAADIVDAMRGLLAQELLLRENEIDDDAPFIELGLDSITGVTWIRKINARFGTDIEATRVYSHPTLASLAGHLAELLAGRESSGAAAATPVRSGGSGDVAATLRELLARELHLGPDEIDDETPFIELGLDSITGVTWVRRINERYGVDIEATRVYSHPTLAEMARLVAEAMPGPARDVPVLTAGKKPAAPTQEAAPTLASWRKPGRAKASAKGRQAPEAIAVIGMAGQFPKAADVDAFWRNIAEGRDCVAAVPAERWSLAEHYREGAPTPGKTNSRWLGALDGYDCFDPLFFSISPTEAEAMDPQQRLFLQAGWHCVENAGYSASALSGSRCGVFVGCGASDYLMPSDEARLSAQGFLGTASSILAARIAYMLNLRGPSLAIDTACSSSLVAFSTACDSLNAGNCDLALAGGVYVMGGPSMHVMTAQAGMLSPDGRCHAFDQRANGFVPGEGVGALLLKRLSDAERDGDRILAVVRGWGVNQDGKSNGITAPNEDAQSELLQSIYRRFGIDPAEIGLIEAHGTGTKLGDPIEVAGLKAAFRPFTNRAGYCAIGSVKSNIGHCLTAAGAAGMIKLVQALRHRQLPPTIHYRQRNEHIQLDGSPFYINDSLRPWRGEDGRARLAAVSSFGFSGTNAHIVLGEYQAPRRESREIEVLNQDGRLMVPLSARTEEQLRRKAADLLSALNVSEPELAELAYTLQLGREAMDERVGFLAASVAELRGQLASFVAGEPMPDGAHRGDARRNRDSLKLLNQDAEVRSGLVEKWLSQRRLGKLLELWAKGLDFDWSLLYPGAAPGRVELPNYPFAAERYWIAAGRPRAESPVDRAEAADEDMLETATPVWDRLFDTGRDASAGRRALVLGADEAQAELLRRHYPAAALAFLADDGEMEELADRLAGQRFDRLVWLAHAGDAAELSEESLIADQESGALRALRLARALQCAGLDSQALEWDWITIGALATHRTEAANPAHAGLQGLCGSLADAYPAWSLRLCDLQTWSADAVAALGGLSLRGKGACYAWRSGEWFARKLVEAKMAQPAETPYRAGGVYVAIGGAGGIGEAWTRHVMSACGAQVVWIGRRPLDEALRRKLDGLAAFGPRPEYIQADARQPGALEAARDEIKRRHGAIHGVAHSAVGAFDQSLKTVSEADFRAVLAAKVDISVRIAQAFAGEALDFALFFSSNASFVRGAGMGGYAAGCAFKDAFAGQLARLWPCAVKVVNWGYWDIGAGDKLSDALKGFFHASGYRPLRESEAMAALDAFLAGDFSQMSISRVARGSAARLCADGEWLAEPAHGATLPALPDFDSQPLPEAFAALQGRAGEQMEPLLIRLMAGVIRGATHPAPGLRRWLEESRKIIARAGVDENAPLDAAWREWDAALPAWLDKPGGSELCRLVDRCVRALPDILSGARKATDVIFPGSSLEWVERVYKTDVHSLAFNQGLRDTLLAAVDARLAAEPSARLRLLEIGAGTGATTSGILDRLAPRADRIEEYAYTDISKAFLFHAEREYAPRAPYLRTLLLNVEKPLAGQDVVPGSYDFVVAANVIHATRNIRNTLRNAKALLRRGGALLMNEISLHSVCGHLTFGLLDGWWLNQDDEVRIPGSPGLFPEAWRRVLEEEGFSAVHFPCRGAHAAGQQIIVAVSDGVMRQREPDTPPPPPPTSQLARVEAPATAVRPSASSLREGAVALCKRVIGEALKIDERELDAETPLERYGIDSIVIGLVNQQLQRHFDDIGSTLLYQFQTIAALAEHLLQTQRGRLEAMFGGGEGSASPTQTSAAAAQPDPAALRAKAVELCRQVFADALKLDPNHIDPAEPLERYGFDSIIVNLVNQHLQQHFGEIGSTLLFQFQTLDALAGHLAQTRADALTRLCGQGAAAASTREPEPAAAAAHPAIAPKQPGRGPIAVIGISGMYPGADNLAAFWQRLKNGDDCVGEIPARRWKLAGFYEPDEQRAVDAGLSYCKWGGFVDRFAEFDTLFFGIPPREAYNMDPQERLFMQSAWHALENAGYTRRDLRERFGGRVGVFAGITRAGYNLHRPLNGNDEKFWPRTSFASVANRLSYFLDINGPSLPVDTMCSSSLTALHEACEHIANGDCDLAFAGGVNLYLHSTSFTDMSSQHMLSADGKCKSFGGGANGFVPGEGVGVVLLKPLERAVADGDIIHGVILATQVNHGGKTNGFTVPNPAAQAELVRRALDKAGISARDVSYIEAHGTGTELGDPIEISGLQQAFAQDTADTGFCAIGSVKSNIGHCEAAAGVAGLSKVLLQIKHGQLAPSLHAQTLNPHIRFDKTPFQVNRELAAWNRPIVGGGERPRIAGISSFGAGGANAHVIVGEYRVQSPARPAGPPVGGIAALPLSARTPEQLRQKARELRDYLAASGKEVDLAALAYTLQVGREAMEERLGLAAESPEQLIAMLSGYADEERVVDGVWRGQAQRGPEGSRRVLQDEDIKSAIAGWAAAGRQTKLLELWMQGFDIDWRGLYRGREPRRIELPGYPFARDEYWLPETVQGRAESAAPQVDGLSRLMETLGRIEDSTLSPAEGARLLKNLV
ncbi:SDR family NAD(P)-dependent oxidoreductase [Chromobacterium vaccinii]|uniref:SDR family NAD(P)-dependent oxidoreductase n=1 Tax=Chromobacterium vaccinii TaxID=1108595 RepID=UPI000617F4F6|nr:SDR family NAD(P)-dependent oxidoreductase [Chromobacterium vaccinii]